MNSNGSRGQTQKSFTPILFFRNLSFTLPPPQPLPPIIFSDSIFRAPSPTPPSTCSPLKVATGGGVDLFAYDRTPEEALEQLRRAKGLSRESGGGDGEAGDDGLSKSGTLEQVMARLQLQSHINQVRTGHEAIIYGARACSSKRAPRLTLRYNRGALLDPSYSCIVTPMS